MTALAVQIMKSTELRSVVAAKIRANGACEVQCRVCALRETGKRHIRVFQLISGAGIWKRSQSN
jgi:hypothetical protein